MSGSGGGKCGDSDPFLPAVRQRQGTDRCDSPQHCPCGGQDGVRLQLSQMLVFREVCFPVLLGWNAKSDVPLSILEKRKMELRTSQLCFLFPGYVCMCSYLSASLAHLFLPLE